MTVKKDCNNAKVILKNDHRWSTCSKIVQSLFVSYDSDISQAAVRGLQKSMEPLQMQIKNMAWDRLWGSDWQVEWPRLERDLPRLHSLGSKRFWTWCWDSPHWRGASCRCSRTSWLRTPSTLASPCRFRDGWDWLREATRKTSLNFKNLREKTGNKAGIGTTQELQTLLWD